MSKQDHATAGASQNDGGYGAMHGMRP